MAKNHFLKLSSKKSLVLGKTMFRVLLPLFASFFVHFQKLIRPHPGPLWGGGVNPYGQPDRKISAFFFDDFPNKLTKLEATQVQN